jgi:hypothetical protein
MHVPVYVHDCLKGTIGIWDAFCEVTIKLHLNYTKAFTVKD